MIAPLVPYYSEVMGLNSGEMGLVFAVYSFALLLFSMLSGSLCHNFGRRSVMLTGLCTLFISTIFFAFAENMFLLLLSRFIQGAAGAAIWTSGLAEAAALFPAQKRGVRLGVMMSLTGLGTIAGPFFSGFIFNYFGYKAPFLGTALIIMPIAIILFFIHPSEDKDVECGLKTSLKTHLADRRILLALSLAAVVSFSFGMLEPLLPLHLSRNFNLDSRGIGVFFGVYSLTFSLIQPLWGLISDRIGYRPLILMGLVGAAVLSPFLALTGQLYLLYFATALFSMSTCAVITPCLPLLAKYSERGGQEAYGRNFGLVNVAWSVGLFLGPPVGGFVDMKFSFLGATVLYSAILIILGIWVIKVRE